MASLNVAYASVSLHSLRFQLAERYARRSDPESGAVYKQRGEGLQMSLCSTVASSAKTPIGWRPCKYWRGLRKCDTKDLKRERNSRDDGRPPHTRNPVQKKSATYGRQGIGPAKRKRTQTNKKKHNNVPKCRRNVQNGLRW